MKRKIGVIGGGSWGTAIAILLLNKGYDVNLYLRDEKQLEKIRDSGENAKYLPGIPIPEEIMITTDLEKSLYEREVVVTSVPSQVVRNVLSSAEKYINKEQIIVNVAKGIENHSLLRISQIVEEILPNNKFAALSGPSHAEEVARNVPTAVVAASKEKNLAEYIQDVFMTPYFRVYTNPDVIGVELGGSLKNVIALGAGISDGLGYGDNTKAALMTRGIIEISRLGGKMGANRGTFSGLAGIGDLIVTCTSMHSRNRRAGILIGQGVKIEDAVKRVGMIVEGIKTTESAYELSLKYNVPMPITKEIYEVLYRGSDVKNSVYNLMLRDKKHEMEEAAQENKYNW